MNRMLLGYSPDLDVFDDAIDVTTTRRAARARTRGDRAALALETDETEQAAELLDAAQRRGISAWLADRLRGAASASGRATNPVVQAELIRWLERAARLALPVSNPASHDAAAKAERFFGIELEGLSAEDQEFEIARRFVQLTTEAARRAASAPATWPAAAAARRAIAQAAQRHAPGWSHHDSGASEPIHRSAGITS